jgi:hypothetical protein
MAKNATKIREISEKEGEEVDAEIDIGIFTGL